MKKLFFYVLILSLFCLRGYVSGAQALYGITTTGGPTNNGVFYKVNIDGSGYSVIKEFFTEYDGGNPEYTKLTLMPSGNLYGMTSKGGLSDSGVIFEYNPLSGGYIKKFDFNSSMGILPFGSLTIGANGKLYGLTSEGGANNVGTLFEFDPTLSAYTKRFDFSSTDGSNPYGSLTLADNGKFYGMTSLGGSNNEGVLFEFDPSTNSYTKKMDFSSTLGSKPKGTLTKLANGKLYGTTPRGGTAVFGGILFEYDPSNNTYVIKFNFDGSHFRPVQESQPTLANNGKLYILTEGGTFPYTGRIYEYDPITGTVVIKYNFQGPTPTGSLTLHSNGKLYGTVPTPPTIDGQVYEFETSTGTLTNIAMTDGYPRGSLTLANGRLYGLTYNGLGYPNGGIFEYDPATDILAKPISFLYAFSGINPTGGTVRGIDGKLYGIVKDGGPGNGGVLFSYDLTSHVYTKKLNLGGAKIYSSLVQASNGKLYGLGSGSNSKIREYNPTNNTMVDFNAFSASIGQGLKGSLIQASDSRLYGVASAGGANGVGVLFEYIISASLPTIKRDFDNTSTGAYPTGYLTEATNAKIYGINNAGIFEYDPVSNSLTKKLVGAGAVGGLVLADNEMLYGIKYDGGTNGVGVLFEYDPFTNSYSEKVHFSAGTTTGFNPTGRLFKMDGKLYGVTDNGGATNSGVIFEYDPSTQSYRKIIDSQYKNSSYGTLGGGTKVDQSIFFGPLPDKYYSDPPFALTATATSGLPVTFTSSDPTVATVSGNVVTILKPGTTMIFASVAGNASYFPAKVGRSFTVLKGSQTIDFPGVTTKTYGDASFQLSATASSGLPVYFTCSTSNVITISGTTATIIGVGTAPVYAHQDGNEFWNPSPNSLRNVQVVKANQSITFNSLPSKTCLENNYSLEATSTSGLSVTFASNNSSIAEISGNVINIKGPGSATITASQPGDANRNPATSVSQLFNVSNGTPVVTAGGPTNFCSNGSVTLSAGLNNSYLWSSGQTTQSITVGTSESYTVATSNTYGCTTNLSSPVNVTVYDLSSSSISATSDVEILNQCPEITFAPTSGDLTLSPITLAVADCKTTAIYPGGYATLIANAPSGSTFTWNKNGYPIFGATLSSYNVTQPGHYSVTVTNLSVCSNTGPGYTVFECTSPDPYIVGSATICPSESVTLEAVDGSPGSGGRVKVLTFTYLWSTGETTQSVVISSPGTYSVIVTNTLTGCRATASFTVSLGSSCPCSSPPCDVQRIVQENTDGPEVTYFPNPANYQLTVVLNKPAEADSPLFLFDVTGRKPISDKFKEGESEKIIFTKELPSGVYTLHTQLKDGLRVQRIIVMHK